MSMNFNSCKTDRFLLFRKEMKCKNAVGLIIDLQDAGCTSFPNPNTAKEIQCTTNNEWTINYQGKQKKILGIFCKVTSDLCITQCPTNPTSTPENQVLYKLLQNYSYHLAWKYLPSTRIRWWRGSNYTEDCNGDIMRVCQ